MEAISAYEVSKKYGSISALHGLNLQVSQGSIFACVGKEKSGKTTLIRLLAGLCRPTAGECSLLGFSPAFEAEKLHGVTGTVLHTSRLYREMTLSENLRFFADINGVDQNDALDRVSFLLHRLDIWEGRDEKPNALPTDVLRRASLARALMHRPQVLLLDEPADGLDTEAATSVQELLTYLISQEGITVLLCTEDMKYAQGLGDEFGLLREGSFLAKGNLVSLRQDSGVPYRAAFRFEEGETPLAGFRLTEGLWKKEIPSEEELPKLISQAVNSGKRLYEAKLIKPSLEEIYTAYATGRVQRIGDADEQGNKYDKYEESSEPAADISTEGFTDQTAAEAGNGEWQDYETGDPGEPEAP